MGNMTTRTTGSVFLGATGVVALADGGLTRLAVSSLLGYGAYKTHQALTAGDYAGMKSAMETKLAEAEGLKDRNKAFESEMRGEIHKVDVDALHLKIASIAVGLVTFVNPLVGVTAVGLLWLGSRSSNRITA